MDPGEASPPADPGASTSTGGEGGGEGTWSGDTCVALVIVTRRAAPARKRRRRKRVMGWERGVLHAPHESCVRVGRAGDVASDCVHACVWCVRVPTM